MTGLPMEEHEHAAATPAERRERFRASLLHPDDLPPAVRARFDADAAEAVDRHQSHAAESLARTAANIAAAEVRHNAGRTPAEVAADSAPVTPREVSYGGPDEDVVYVGRDPDGLGVTRRRLPPGALPARQLTPTPARATVRRVDLYRTVLNAIPHGPACGAERDVDVACACDLAAQEADADAVTRAVEGLLRGAGIGVDQRSGTDWDHVPARHLAQPTEPRPF